MRSTSNCNNNKNYIPRIKMVRICIEGFFNKNIKYNILGYQSQVDWWKEKQELEDKQYQKQRKKNKRR